MPNTPPSRKPSSQSGAPSVRAKMPAYVLDAHALMAYLQKEKGHERVENFLARALKGEVTVLLSLINWGEIVYNVQRDHGKEVADELIQDIDRGPITLAQVTRKRVDGAARIKSQYRLSYADAFAVALAQELDAAVITGDPEFRAVENIVTVDWLR